MYLIETGCCFSQYSAISISVDGVSNGLKHAKLGKFCGLDGISAEHLIYMFTKSYAKVHDVYTKYKIQDTRC